MFNNHIALNKETKVCKEEFIFSYEKEEKRKTEKKRGEGERKDKKMG